MAFSVLYTIKDAKAESSTCEINVPDNLTLANLSIFAQQMALLIGPLITGAITRIGVALSVDLPGGLDLTPNVGSDVEEGAKFQFRTAGGYYTGLRIPTFSEALISPTGKEVDTEDTDVAAFVAAMISGIDLTGAGGTGTVAPTDKREDDVVSLEFAKEQFVRSRS